MIGWLAGLNAWLTEWDNFWKVMVGAWALALCIFGIDWILRRQDRREGN